MLGFVPEPVNGELLYSLVARWRAELDCSVSVAMRSWFGDRHAGLPSMSPRVGLVAARVPPHSGLDVDTLIEEHTLLPYFSGFMQPKVFDETRRCMVSGGTLHVTITAGGARRSEARLLFCPECAAADVNGVGAATWRREHQVPGVYVCYEHACRLREGELRGHPQFPTLVTPPADLDGAEIACPFPDDAALRIARLASGLAGPSRPPAGKPLVAARVRRLLDSRGYIGLTGKIRLEHLMTDLRSFHGTAGLNSAGRGGEGAVRPARFVSRLASDAGESSGTPLHLILILAALGCDWPEFARDLS